MINKLRIALLLFIGILLSSYTEGQGNTDFTVILKEKFDSYCKMFPREEIYSQTDRSEYIAGETAWFSLFVINRQTGLPSDISSIVYVELLNSDNRSVVRKKIMLKNSFGEGELDIPDTLSTGSYTMRAYTSWMKNFLPNNCFSTDLIIYNVLSNKVIPDRIRSGKIVPPIPGNIAVKRYSNRGISILADSRRTDSLSVLIITDSLFRSHNKNRFYLFIQTHGIIDLAASYTANSDTTRVNINKARLGCGINQITAFGADGNPVAEQYSYTSKPGKNSLSLRTAGNYHTRDKVLLEMEYTGESDLNNDSLHLGISVSPYTGRAGQEDISDYMVFGSEYGPLPHHLINGRKLNDISSSTLDSILSAINSSWIDWSRIIGNILPDVRFKPEKENICLSGRLLFSDGISHKNEIVIMCSPGKKAQFQYCYTDSTGNFKFITGADLSRRDIILMPDKITGNPSIIIDSPFSDIYPVKMPQTGLPVTELPEYIPKWMINYQVERIYGSRSFKSPDETSMVPEDTVAFYGKPDFELIMSDYVKLPRMEEVFFEILPHVSLKKRNDEYEVKITDRIDNSPYITSPSLMIDGVLIKDAKMIADLDPEKVLKIDVIESKYLVGKYLFPGIVNVITESAGFRSVTLPGYMLRMIYSAADPVKTFYSPDYSSESALNNTEPDYRTTLYWNPSVNISSGRKKSLQFRTCDNKSDYIINIQGLTNTGRMVSFQKIIHVR